jgi:hypothetical protein
MSYLHQRPRKQTDFYRPVVKRTKHHQSQKKYKTAVAPEDEETILKLQKEIKELQAAKDKMEAAKDEIEALIPTCPICLERKRNTLELPCCYNAFCTDCLGTMVNAAGRFLYTPHEGQPHYHPDHTDNIKCPLCRTEHRIQDVESQRHSRYLDFILKDAECPHCDTVGSGINQATHMFRCARQRTACPLCQDPCLVDSMNYHFHHECDGLVCPFCSGENNKRRNYAKHMEHINFHLNGDLRRFLDYRQHSYLIGEEMVHFFIFLFNPS